MGYPESEILSSGKKCKIQAPYPVPERLDAIDPVHLEIMHPVIDQIPWFVENGDGSLGIAGINLVTFR